MLRADRTVIDGLSAASRRQAYHDWLAESADTISLEAAARHVAAEQQLEPAAIAAESREVLVTAMAAAAVDVPAVAAQIGWNPALLRAMLRGETNLTLGEYATIEAAIAVIR